MIDQSTINLPAIIALMVPLVASHHELRGRCPFHKGKTDTSLKVWQENDDQGRSIWHWCCHAGCGGGDAMSWIAKRDGLDLKRSPDFRRALEVLGVAASAQVNTPAADPEPTEPVIAPSTDWQSPAIAFVETCADALWGDYEKPMGWLMERGFTQATLVGNDIGYNAEDHYVDRTAWGLPIVEYTDEKGQLRTKSKIWLPRGVVIPWFVGRLAGNGGELWKIIIRRPTGAPKYYQVPGCSNGLFNVDRLRPDLPVMLCEAALDALAVQQEAGDLITAVATGTTGARAARWIAPLSAARARLLSFDADAGGDNPLTYWRSVFPDAKEWRPYYDDPAAMLQSGGDLRAWVEHGLEDVPAPLPIAQPVARAAPEGWHSEHTSEGYRLIHPKYGETNWQPYPFAAIVEAEQMTKPTQWAAPEGY